MRGRKRQKSDTKRLILEKTGGVCARCGKPVPQEKVTIDHFVPKYRGGDDDDRNLLPLCKNCNKQKGSRVVTTEEYYPYLKDTYRLMADEYKAEWERGI
ncbi:HNH endonuclease [Butyrivibrio sp. NC2007]|uniref:HNH endonuclease n=1 Tax=Butyrivibrio sp. NC2007 TaxID=1280683 RepID=UPI0003B5EE65|nr:HNH endonuclease signature motif containing protein [Butyrivibrio sp. NC2007]